MMDTDFFRLLYTHLEEWEFHNVCQNLKRDEDYLEASTEEAIHAQNAAYTMVVFRMAMQCCFPCL